MLTDLRFALRSLAKSPLFVFVALASFTLAIGTCATLFTLINGFLYRKLAPRDPDALVQLHTGSLNAKREYRFFSYAEYTALQESHEVFSDVAAISIDQAGVGEADNYRRVPIQYVTGNYFSMLGVQAHLGRLINEQDSKPNDNQAVAVVSHAFWKHMGGKEDYIGKQVRVKGANFTVVGIAPESFTGLSSIMSPEIWLPMGSQGYLPGNSNPSAGWRYLMSPGTASLPLIGRLNPGMTLETAQTQMGVISKRLDSLNPGKPAQGIDIRPIKMIGFLPSASPNRLGKLEQISWSIFSVGFIVLCLACMNLAGTQYARCIHRVPELATRQALGATRWSLIRLILLEGLVLSLAGGALGLLAAQWCSKLVLWTITQAIATNGLALILDVPLDFKVVAIVFALCLIATLITSLSPALKTTKGNLVVSMNRGQGGARADTWGRIFSLRSILVVGQVSIAFCLVFVSGVLIRALGKQLETELGYLTQDRYVAEFQYRLSNTGWNEGMARQSALLEKISMVPGVEQATLASGTPNNRGLRLIGQVSEPREGKNSALARTSHSEYGSYLSVGFGYFQHLGRPIIQGRDFSKSECTSNADRPVVIIDDALAKALFKSVNPIGQRIVYQPPNNTQKWFEAEVIGIVQGKKPAPNERRPQLRFYTPIGQQFWPDFFVHLRVSPNTYVGDVLQRVRACVQEADPQNPPLRIQPLIDVADEENFGLALRGIAGLMLFFGLIILSTATIGIYGVKSYTVAQRTKELGVRIAIGANTSDILHLVMRQSLWQLGAGLLLGYCLIVMASSGLRLQFTTIQGVDPLVLTIAAGVIITAMLLACWLPARRATKINPVEAIRIE